jgi:hypothetical protein
VISALMEIKKTDVNTLRGRHTNIE